MKMWVLLTALAMLLSWFTVQSNLAQASNLVEFYRERPGCANPAAVDLPSSWKTPMSSGLTVWVCK